MRIATPAFFFLLPIFMEYVFPSSYSLYVSWGLKWDSHRQHVYGSCFCIHSASLCLLLGTFNPFTCKVIIDIYVPIAIFLFGVDFVDLFSSLVFLDYTSPFNICCKAGLVVLNSFNFCFSESFYFSINFEWDTCRVQWSWL